MKRREFFSRSMFGTIAATFSSIFPGYPAPAEPRIFPENYNASEKLAHPDWIPVFFNEHQNDTVVALSDLIIPETDTPGAKVALVNRFIDHLLSVETPETQKEFLDSLAFLNGESRKRYGKAFVYLPSERQNHLLKLMAYPHQYITWRITVSPFEGYEHFTRLKDYITRAFYNSETGMRELGWTGNVFHSSLEGCTHSEGTHK